MFNVPLSIVEFNTVELPFIPCFRSIFCRSRLLLDALTTKTVKVKPDKKIRIT